MDCIIRTWEPADAAQLAKALSNPNILNNLRDGLPYPYTEKDAQAYIAAMREADAREVFAFAIVADGAVAGSIGAFRCGNIHARTAELGYYIAEEYWGKGLMTSAVKQTCAYVFEHSDILRIFAEPFSHNAASCRVLEKAGFQFEGLLRKNAVKNGQVLDMKLYALVREDPPENTAAFSAHERRDPMKTIHVVGKMATPVQQKDGTWKVILEDHEEDIPDLGREDLICNKCGMPDYPECKKRCRIWVKHTK